jgi:hypothetical protein
VHVEFVVPGRREERPAPLPGPQRKQSTIIAVAFFGTAALAIAAAQLGMIGSVKAQPSRTKLPAIKPGTNTSFASMKQIDAGVLNVGYTEAGPANGPAVIDTDQVRTVFNLKAAEAFGLTLRKHCSPLK